MKVTHLLELGRIITIAAAQLCGCIQNRRLSHAVIKGAEALLKASLPVMRQLHGDVHTPLTALRTST